MIYFHWSFQLLNRPHDMMWRIILGNLICKQVEVWWRIYGKKNRVIIASDDGLSPARDQAIT